MSSKSKLKIGESVYVKSMRKKGIVVSNAIEAVQRVSGAAWRDRFRARAYKIRFEDGREHLIGRPELKKL